MKRVKRKNWELADQIRDDLIEEGYKIEDNPRGTWWENPNGSGGIVLNTVKQQREITKKLQKDKEEYMKKLQEEKE